VRLSAGQRRPERRSNDGQPILKPIQMVPDLRSDLGFLVELWGFEPQTSCMPSSGNPSTGVHPRRSQSQGVRARPSRSAPVAVLSCCTARSAHQHPYLLRHCLLDRPTSARHGPSRRATARTIQTLPRRLPGNSPHDPGRKGARTGTLPRFWHNDGLSPTVASPEIPQTGQGKVPKVADLRVSRSRGRTPDLPISECIDVIGYGASVSTVCGVCSAVAEY